MTGVMGKILIAGFVLTSIVACSNDDSGKKVSNEADTYSCLFPFSKGDQADYSALGTANNVQTYFEKEYNQNYLNAVSTSSVEATMDFINQTDVTIYKSEKIKTNLCSRNLFETAKDMTYDVESRWKEAKGSIEEGEVLGLYLPKVDNKAFPSLKNNAAIVVRENTNRWTLVHEFMHHLFMLRSMEQGYNYAQAQNDFDVLLKEAYNPFPEDDEPLSEAQAMKFAIPYAKFTKAADSRLIHYALEEMTIEATLKDAASAGSLKYVPTGENNWYLAVSAKKALGAYAILAKHILRIVKTLPTNANKETSALYDAIMTIQKRMKTIKTIQERFPYDLPQSEGLVAAEPRQHIGCSHEAEGDEVIKAIEKRNRKTK